MEFSVDFSRLNKAIAKVRSMTGVPLAQIVRRQFHILMYHLARDVFPPKAESQGKKSLARDVRRAIRVDLGKGWKEGTNERLAKRIKLLVRRKNLTALNAIYANANASPKRVFVPFSVSRHLARRYQTAKGIKINRPNPMEVTVESAAHKKHVTEMQKRVGRLKAGWLAGWYATKVGGQRILRGWITRHRLNAKGTANPHLTGTNPWVSATNRNPGVERFASGVQKALAIRARAMINDVKHQLRRATEAAKLK
jgi:hypothetical protein